MMFGRYGTKLDLLLLGRLLVVLLSRNLILVRGTDFPLRSSLFDLRPSSAFARPPKAERSFSYFIYKD